MARSIFFVADMQGQRYEVLAECSDTVEAVLKLAVKHYKIPMRDVMDERRLTREEEAIAILRFGWALRLRRKLPRYPLYEDI